MPTSVRLDFTPPTLPNVIKLHIEEAPDKAGPFAEIEETTAVGSPGNYISYYVTQNATVPDDWFRIRWETSDSIFTPFSEPLQGGTKTLVQEIVDRVLLRNPSLNENIVTQEAQAVVSETMGTQDPNSVQVEEATYVQLRGMTNMTLARSLIATTLATGGGTVSGFTAGLVSIKASTSSSSDPTKAIEALLKSANNDLGKSASLVLLMAEISLTGYGYCGSSGQLHGVDLTRSVIDYDVPAAISP